MRALVGALPPDAGEPAARAVGAPEPEPPAWVPGMSPPPRHAATGAGAPGGRRGRVRWDPGRRGVAGLGVAVIAVLVATGWWLATGRPSSLPVTESGPVGPAVASSQATTAVPVATSVVPPGASLASGAGSPATASRVVVDVAGKVRRPGVYRLPAGSRVFDALRVAGGPRPGVSTISLNLAAPLVDGEQIVVGAPGGGSVVGGAPAGPVGPAAGTGSAAAGSPLNLNAATLDQLVALPGVGPALAQNILDWRAAHGRFSSVAQLQDVSGIGPAKLAALHDLVTV